jgi:hypothetical protein
MFLVRRNTRIKLEECTLLMFLISALGNGYAPLDFSRITVYSMQTVLITCMFKQHIIL